MKRALFLYAGFLISVVTMFGQELPKLKVTKRDMTGVIFRYVKDNETVVEVQSNVKLEFESTMDTTVNVYKTYEDNGFFYYELLFPTNPITVPTKFDGRKLKIKSYGYEIYMQPLDLKEKVPIGLLVTSELKSNADDLYNAGKFSEALKDYEKLYSINPDDEYVKHRIKECNDKINNEKAIIEAKSPKLNFIFGGIKKKQNPSVKLYLDNQLIGEGNFHEGFNIQCPDIKSGMHELRAVWSGNISDKTYKINTITQKVFEFDCEMDGFGHYRCVLKK